METANEPLFVSGGAEAPRDGLPFVEREAIVALVRDPKTGKYLALRWKKVDWEAFVTGGVEDGQTPEEAARAEVREETGYKNLRLVTKLPGFRSKFYHAIKRINRVGHFHSFLFELEDDECAPIAEEEREQFEPVWLDVAEIGRFRLPEGHRFLFDGITA